MNTKFGLDYETHNVLRKTFTFLFWLFGTQQDRNSEIKNGIKNEEKGKYDISKNVSKPIVVLWFPLETILSATRQNSLQSAEYSNPEAANSEVHTLL